VAELLVVQGRAGVVLGEDPLEGRIVSFHGLHGVVHHLPDGGLAGVLLKPLPAGFGRYPEDVGGPVLVGVLGVRVGF